MAVTEPRSYAEIQRIREMQKEAQLAEARRAEEAARRESAIRQQAASQATERQPIEFPKSTVENAQETLADPRFSPQQSSGVPARSEGGRLINAANNATLGPDPLTLPKSQGQPGSTPSTPKNLDFPGESMSSSAERIRQKKLAADRNEGISGDPSVTTATDGSGTVDEATRQRAIRMADAGLSGDTNIVGSMRHGDSLGVSAHGADHGDVELETFAPADPDDMTKGRRRFWTASDAQPSVDKLTGEVTLEPTAMPEESPAARQAAADAMQEQDDQKASAEAATASAKGDALEDAYGNFLQSLQASGQKKMLAYYMNPEPNEDGKTGKQLFIEDVLESDQNSPEEQQSVMGDISRAQDRRFTNKVPDFDENTTSRPGVNRQMTNDARGTREFERRLDQKNIPEKLRDPDKNMVPTNMFDPETGEPGIAGQSPNMVGEGMPKRAGGSAIYGPLGTKWQRRGMDMGDQHGPNGSGDGDANYMMSLMTEENWNNLRDQDRRDLVMNLANRLGYLDGIKELPEEDQYYAAKRAVFSHIFQTGDGATKIWAANEADLDENTDLIDPNKKPMLENVWDDNTGQWVLKQSQDSRDRARMRSATAFASRGMKGHSQIDQYMNPDGTMNTEAAGAKMLEVINKERVNMGQEPVASVDELNENERLAYDQGMRLLGDMPRYAKVKQNNMDQGRGQMMMGHAGNASQWRLLGAYNRELDAAETLAEKAEIARKYNNRVDMTRFDEGANAQADRDAAAEAAALEKSERDELIKINREEKRLDRENDLKKTEIANQPDPAVPYYDRLGAAESPQEAMIIHRGELSSQLDSIKDEDGFFTYEDVMKNNNVISILNNMYLHPDMGRSWFEWFKGENEDELNAESYQMHMDNYIARVISDLGFNAPGHEEDRKKMTTFLTQNFMEKFREVNPRLASKILPMVANQSGGDAGQDTAQDGLSQEYIDKPSLDSYNTEGKEVEGPQEDSLPAIPSGNAPGTRARRRGKAATGASWQFRSPFEANPSYSPRQ